MIAKKAIPKISLVNALAWTMAVTPEHRETISQRNMKYIENEGPYELYPFRSKHRNNSVHNVGFKTLKSLPPQYFIKAQEDGYKPQQTEDENKSNVVVEQGGYRTKRSIKKKTPIRLFCAKTTPTYGNFQVGAFAAAMGNFGTK